MKKSKCTYQWKWQPQLSCKSSGAVWAWPTDPAVSSSKESASSSMTKACLHIMQELDMLARVYVKICVWVGSWDLCWKNLTSLNGKAEKSFVLAVFFFAEGVDSIQRHGLRLQNSEGITAPPTFSCLFYFYSIYIFGYPLLLPASSTNRSGYVCKARRGCLSRSSNCV